MLAARTIYNDLTRDRSSGALLGFLHLYPKSFFGEYSHNAGSAVDTKIHLIRTCLQLKKWFSIKGLIDKYGAECNG